MEVIPAINCHDKDTDCVTRKLETIKGFSKWVHLDVADGAFTFNRSWAEPREWKEIAGDMNLEVHLMVEDPERHAKEWLEVGAKRIIVHFETLDEASSRNLKSMARENSASLMIAISPETQVSELWPEFESFFEFEVLAVHPGLSGQKFLPSALDKISEIKKKMPNSRVSMDGGVDANTARMAKDSGADSVVSASFIFTATEPAAAYKKLSNVF